MEYLVKSGSIASEKSACAIVAVFSDGKLSSDAKALDELYDGSIHAAVTADDIEGKLGQTLLLRNASSASHKRILLVGCGDEKKLNVIALHKVLTAAAKAIKSTGSKDALSTLHRLQINDLSLREKIRHTIVDFEDIFYQYDETFSEKKPAAKLKQVKILISNANETKQANKGITQGTAIAAGQSLAKDLGNRPGNICTPTHLESTARSIKRGQRKLSVSVLEEAEMEELGMGSLLSVSRGSAEPAKLIVLQYKGAAASKKPFVLVGKGITFDTGGISLKPGAAMDEMKFDMCGAASVLGTMKACAQMELPINVVGVVASAENMPGGKATKPGDIVTTMSGKTVEILNTDAEGRLVLCDALTYVDRYKPEVVIDIATLTGACVVALGHEASGLLSNSDKLTDDLLETGQRTGDRAWQLPIWDEYQPLLDSNFADIANIGGRWAGTITAACFLSRFTEDYKWAHLDIAGTAWHMGKNKGATGRPVPLLTAYLMKKARVF